MRMIPCEDKSEGLIPVQLTLDEEPVLVNPVLHVHFTSFVVA